MCTILPLLPLPRDLQCVCFSQLQQYARARDAHEVSLHWAKINFFQIRAAWILAVDETSTDLRDVRRSFGYGLRGGSRKPVGNSGLLPRGERVSALAAFDITGFVAWEYTGGTFTRDEFLSKAESVIVSLMCPV